LRQRAAGEALTIVGDGEQRRDFTHVSDVVQANVLAATTEVDESAFGQLYNIGNGKNYSVNELAAMISDNTTNIPPRIGEARISLANNKKMKTTFNWNPQVKLSDWVKEQL
jgi:UDP-glucose 4-epimerase